eukprot:CAMPEP_0184479334 /NCGR_PEP_ID=MMETSP0113_2-20130426/1099_1 /TAXON_ID=91329 /ORGANISM="Norrisiella sphaerica, Strain BC52" /LENGTH=300 /DNA_ID=CAMNT_0026857393 /DNA_START=240 /DNA_END=1139 /DNA_ORIENTATION=+
MMLLIFQLIFVLGTKFGDIEIIEPKNSPPASFFRCNEHQDIVVGTRFWGKQPTDLQNLDAFLRTTEKAVGSRLCALLVTVNTEDDTQNTVEKLQDMGNSFPRLETWGVTPWSITTPLNAMLKRAKQLGSPFILYTSVEIHLDSIHLRAVINEMRVPDTLVVGVALKGHQNMEALAPKGPTKCESEKTSELYGDTVPWNTFALWNVEKLAKLGFLLSANLQEPPGMEEPVPIALLQQQSQTNSAKAKLLHFVDDYKPVWNVNFDTEERRIKQIRKMTSKTRRTQAQLEEAGVQGQITHIKK